MKNNLILLKKLIKNKVFSKDGNKKIVYIAIANSLGLDFAMHKLTRISTQNDVNCYKINAENMIFFYPVNDGMPTCPFEFFKDDEFIISNQKVYSEITNLDEIIL